jgi:hypothetical protein
VRESLSDSAKREDALAPSTGANRFASAKDKVKSGRMKKVLVFAAIGEAATGLALLIVPSLVVQLLLGEELAGVAIPVARVTGIALIALAVACWPGPPAVGMLTYSAAVTLYLSYVGLSGHLTGVFLWPAVIVHVILTALLTWALLTWALARDPEMNT